MKIRLIARWCLLVFLTLSPASAQTRDATPVKISKFDILESDYIVHVELQEARVASRAIILFELRGRDGFVLAPPGDLREGMETTVTQTRLFSASKSQAEGRRSDQLTHPDGDRSRLFVFEGVLGRGWLWDAKPRDIHRVFAVACQDSELRSYRVLLDALRPLPFSRTNSIDQVLGLVEAVGCRPTGFTGIAESPSQ